MSKEKAYAYIRWSSKKQEGNDSKRRQLSLAQEYAEKKTLDLVVLIDEGVSAFHGGHFEQGKLGQFFKDVRNGVIEEGSTFIIERMDRLSREGLFKDRVKELLDEGIKIYISGTGRFLTKKTWDISDEIISAIERDLAHKESAQKSDRLTKAWEDKRDEAAEGRRKLSKICPGWLEPVLMKDENGNVVKDKNDKEIVTEFEEKDERISKAINLIYKWKLEGFGNKRIARKLNEREDTPHPSKLNSDKKTTGWRKSYIRKILHSESVIGEYQPHEIYWEYSERAGKKVRKRRPKGDPIKGYYDPVLKGDEGKELYEAVQNKMKELREKYGSQGGADKKHYNLFRNVIKCGVCGKPMHYLNKGDYSWLYCDASRNNFPDENDELMCTASPVRYKEFEQKFFNEFEELDINKILPNAEKQADKVSELDKKIRANRNRIDQLKEEEKNLLDSIKRSRKKKRIKAVDRLEQELEENIIDREEIAKVNKDLERQKNKANEEEVKLRQAANQTKEYYDLLESADTEKQRTDYRIRLNNQIKDLVKKIQVYPLQEPYQNEPIEVDPGIYRIYDSKYIDKIRITFTSGNVRLLLLKSHVDLAQ